MTEPSGTWSKDPMQTVRNVDPFSGYYEYEEQEINYYDYYDEEKKEEWGWESRDDFNDDYYP